MVGKLRCPSVDRLADYAAARLLPTEREDVRHHAADCAACRLALSEIARSLEPVPPVTGAELEGGTVLQRYSIRRRLGGGGAGVVYLAHDSQLDRPVALKILHRSVVGDEPLLEEARSLARVRHSNVVTVFDAAIHGGRLCIVMEYVDGVTLRSWMTSGPRRWRQTLDVFIEAGRGLAAAHGAAIAHGDFKPDNVLVSREGRVQVSDFGLARPVRSRPEAPSALLGTPAYMAPEQLSGWGADARTDQFSFCVALYEALLGHRPSAGSRLDEPRRSGWRETTSFSKGRPLPRMVIRALDRGLATRPEARYPSMEALLTDLQSWPRRRRILAASIGALALSVLVARAVRYEKTPLNRVCRVDSRHAGALLNEKRRAVHDAFVGAAAPAGAAALGKIDSELEAYVRSWVTARVGACEDADATEATDSTAKGRYLGRLRCFDDLRSRWEAVTAALSRTPADQETTGRLISGLPPPEICLAR